MRIISRIWQRGWLGKLVVLIFGCFALVFVSAIIRGISGGNPQPASAPVSLVKPVVTQLATIPATTATIKATTTQEPTATSVPTESSTVESTATSAPPKPTRLAPTDAPPAVRPATLAPTKTPVPVQLVTLAPTETPASIQPTAVQAVEPSYKNANGNKIVVPAYWPCKIKQIKGNINTKLYHLPSGQFYERTYDNVKCFDTAEQAEAAGYTASKR